MRKVPLVTNQIYHLFNRGVNKNDIFFSQKDYERFLAAAKHYITKNSKFSYEKPQLDETGAKEANDPVSLASNQKIEIIAFCLMPNHFHFLMKQLSDNGITIYMRRFMNSYVHYVNVKNKRVGPLFQGRFKNVLIGSDEQLLHVSRYIHLNPLIANLVSSLDDYPWSSYPTYLGKTGKGIANPENILSMFKNKKDYKKFLEDQEDYARSLEKLKHLENF